MSDTTGNEPMVSGALDAAKPRALKKDEITPGPWRIGFSDGSGSGGLYNEWERGGIYINDQHDNVVVWGGDNEGLAVGVRREADARLIAAAPQVLEALQAMLEAFGRTPDAKKNKEYHACGKAYEAIKAATGQSPRF